MSPEHLDTTPEGPGCSLCCHNPEAITYSYRQLEITVLGGIRLEGLDRLRTTLKIEYQRKAIRHNLDLYNDTQVEKLSRRTAEKLEVGTSYINDALAELTNHLEAYRLQEISKQEDDQPKQKELTGEETRQAKALLKTSYLLKATNKLIGQSGVIGEETNRLLMYLIYTSRKREHPLHIISLGSSGTGKTYLQEKVGELIPAYDKIEITTLSDNAFYYFGAQELKNKLILIEDLDGAESVLYPLRELQSKKKISKTVAHKDSKGRTRTQHLTVEGPVSVAGCTTRESIYEDNANRSFLIYLDESPEQDERIMDYQRAASAGQIDHQAEEQARQLLQNSQRLLKPVKVINPYAPKLKIPTEVFKPRRTNNHYLQFIEAITYYHQYQREEKAHPETGEIYIETTLEDIANANQLMKTILLRKSDELSGACRNYFERLKAYLMERETESTAENKSQPDTSFTNKEARAALKENHSNQKRYMLALQQCGLVHKSSGDKKKGFTYQVVSMEEYRQLQEGITGVLDQILENLQKEACPPSSKSKGVVQSSKEVHKSSEPPKAKKTSKIDKQFRRTGKEQAQELKAPIREGAHYTYKSLQSATKAQPGSTFTVKTVSQMTGKSKRTEADYLKELTEAGLLERQKKNQQYHYHLCQPEERQKNNLKPET